MAARRDLDPAVGAALLPLTARNWASRRLLDWFDRHQRDLPWRRDRDPYRIWVSEVMLQQTTVAAVVPYFERFLAAFPTLADLAAADEQAVLRLWEGLGYYRRARDLSRAARELQSQYAGSLPDDPELLAKLPGFGLYTRNAVLSQAFDRRLPIVEANSQRVLSRLLGLREDPRGGAGRRTLWHAAEALLPRARVGAYNQALMELGALVCTPKAPRCDACPLADRCQARILGLQEAIPVKAVKTAITTVREAAVVIWRDDRVLLVRRPQHAARWAGLWEFPHGPLLEGETHESAALRLAADLVSLEVELGPELRTIRHGITRYRVTIVAFEGRRSGGQFQSSFYSDALWLTPSELSAHPVSAPQRRLAEALTESSRQLRLF